MNRLGKYLTLILVAYLSVIGISEAQELDKHLIGYYTSWSIYARDYHVPDIPADQISHINYAFANISASAGTIILGDSYADIDRFYPGDSWEPGSLRGCFHQLQILKEQHPHLKTFISVGGWTWSGYFSDVALTEQSRHTFAVSCAAFIDQYDFDGVDIDWEYPVSGGLPGNHYRPEDRENYTLLMAELRAHLDSLEDVNGREYLLTIAAPANPDIIANIEVDLIHQYLDWINIMTYDFHGPWGGDLDPVTNFNSPLYMSLDDPLEEPAHSSFNLEAAVQAYLDLGVPADKINPGLAFYGRGFGNVADVNDGLYAYYQGAAPVGTWENGVFDYWDLAQNYVNTGGYTAYRHDQARVPWLYNQSAHIMISYDDSLSIAEKGLFVVDNNLGGAMFWEFSGDKYGVLLSSIHDALSQATDIADNITGALPQSIELHQNYPNPFNAQTKLAFTLSQPAQVTIDIYGLLGQRVATLGDGYYTAGDHQLIWNADAETSGVYFVRLQAGETVLARRMLLIK
ncbi:MAG: T9SS type A sorting domain-containing protein [candidate division Zixibacteria bacterium]|nr:T9SS type A sorting domain-containing protein [candidate division Zixibacteria bacterium]